MAFGRNKEERKPRRGASKAPMRRKSCRVCTEQGIDVDYKNVRALLQFVTERGKLIPRRITGTCAEHQRDVTLAVRRARLLAFIPFTSIHAVNL